ncbi:hypothetical protein CGCSCA5_v010153 [Colletotrichum siamense]|nr:hypothetical protein CGCSCA5_v010153 [Colletotrichum siamense]
MGELRLDKLPVEILRQICSKIPDIEDDGDYEIGAEPSLLALSHVCRRLRSVAVAELFKFINPQHMYGGPRLTAFIPLLLSFMANPVMAAEVKDISTYPALDLYRGTRDNHMDLVSAAEVLGVPVPRALTWKEASVYRVETSEMQEETKGKAAQFLTEMIMAHTPNVRTVYYQRRNNATFFKTLSSVAKATGKARLLEKLHDFNIDNLGAAENIQPLSEWAPNLDSLWLETVHGPVSELKFDTVRVLLLTMANLTGPEMKELIRGFPNVKKFWFSWTDDLNTGDREFTLEPRQTARGSREFTPREMVEALKPLQHQLTELTLHSNGALLQAPKARRDQLLDVITSFKNFEVLERLDIDGVSLYDPWHHLYDGENADTVRRFGRMLPERLETLDLMDLRRGPVDDDLLAFASHVGQCCPKLRKIRYRRMLSTTDRSEVPPEELEELKELFGRSGVEFEADESGYYKVKSWRR